MTIDEKVVSMNCTASENSTLVIPSLAGISMRTYGVGYPRHSISLWPLTTSTPEADG